MDYKVYKTNIKNKKVGICKDEEGYRFIVIHLTPIEKLESYLFDNWKTQYKRDKVAIVYKIYYLTEETLTWMFNLMLLH